MTHKRDSALVTFKPCPKCHGTGQVPCNGREHFRAAQEKWAKSLDGLPVLINCLARPAVKGGPWSDTWVPGLAVAKKLRGWWGLNVYVAVSDIPLHGSIVALSDGRQCCVNVSDGVALAGDAHGYMHALLKVSSVDVYAFDEVAGKALWHLDTTDETCIRPLHFWPEQARALKSTFRLGERPRKEGWC